MKFSVLISIVGLPYDRSLCDVTYIGAADALAKAVVDNDDEEFRLDESEMGDTDYEYLACEDGLSDEQITEIRAHLRILGDEVTYHLTDFGWASRIGIAGRTLTASGVLGKARFKRLIDDLGAYASDVETMGTLGGPLSGGMPTIVPDVDFVIESPLLIACIRVTPFPTDGKGEPLAGNEQTWPRLRRAMLSVFGL